MKRENGGRDFEIDISKSCDKLGIFSMKIKDTFIPIEFREKIKVTRNKYDFIIFDQQYLFPLELKSAKTKSFSFSESIIKQHQIDALVHAQTYPNIIAGFIFNFREPENLAYFVQIEDFVKYKDIAENNKEHTYKSKVNRSSIPLSICEEIGIKIECRLKKVKYHYMMDEFIEEAIERYQAKE